MPCAHGAWGTCIPSRTRDHGLRAAWGSTAWKLNAMEYQGLDEELSWENLGGAGGEGGGRGDRDGECM